MHKEEQAPGIWVTDHECRTRSALTVGFLDGLIASAPPACVLRLLAWRVFHSKASVRPELHALRSLLHRADASPLIAVFSSL